MSPTNFMTPKTKQKLTIKRVLRKILVVLGIIFATVIGLELTFWIFNLLF